MRVALMIPVRIYSFTQIKDLLIHRNQQSHFSEVIGFIQNDMLKNKALNSCKLSRAIFLVALTMNVGIPTDAYGQHKFVYANRRFANSVA